ncbi:hypothetical protein [Hydrogenobacter thermophilus]|uniref:Uncharacterized protein n=1 Tax=Hydrogenobacter thermophilus (strain DSM 6534 / IAM 12695 / TK-6) TaxID=608538 RepID=D3DHS2_HYDTT|nr:hypothetical protein [Hydrogenobacter thermophilus]BAI69374.1 hypothetical protein HTH_0915 [Hydrogenobacter thermophilus TK-6]
MKRVKIPWQGNSPLYFPGGVINFKDGVSVDPVPEQLLRRLLAIYGNQIEVIDDEDRTEDQEAPADTTNKRSRKKS